jgi:transcriptional regulator with XRE-family HTH domain
MTGAALKKDRQKLGLTQAGLARRIGVHEVTIAKWETNAVKIPKPIALLIELLVEKEKTENRG